MDKRIIILTTIMGLFLAGFSNSANAQDKGGSGGGLDKAFAYPGKEGVFIIVPADAAKGGAGFMVYRAEQPAGGAQGEAVQVTAAPVAPIKNTDEIIAAFGPTAVGDLADLGLKSPDDFWAEYKKDPDKFEFLAWYSIQMNKVLGHIYEDRGVTAGAEYSYRVEIVDATGKTIRKFDSLTVKAAPPEIPGLEGFKGENKDGAAKLSWKKTDGGEIAIGIDIYRGNSEGGPFEKANDKIIAISGDPYYTDGGLENNKTYYYYAVAVDFVGNTSPQSETVKIATRDMTPPLPPANVNVELKDGKPVLSWDMSLEPDLEGYDVHRSINSDTGFATLTLTPARGDVTAYTDEAAENGTPYYYRLTAIDKTANNSTASVVVQVKMPDTVPPALPLGFEGKPGGKNSIVLTWRKSAEPDLLGYYIYRGMDPAKLERAHMDIIAREKLKFEDNGVVSGKTYYYALAAVDNSMNESILTDPPLKVAAPDSLPPQPPIGLFAMAEDGVAALSWAESMESDVAGYRLYFSHDENGKFSKIGADVPKGELKVADGPVENGKKRWYYLTAFDASGNESEASSKVSATPFDVAPPEAPAGATGTLVANSVKIKWAAAPEKDIAGYVVCRAAVSGNGLCETVSGEKPLPKQKISFEDKTLSPGVQYWYKITSVDTSGNKSAKSEPAGPFKIEPAAPAKANPSDNTIEKAAPASGRNKKW